MIATLHPLDLAVLGVGDSGTVRDPGLHASDIFNDLFQELEPNRYQRDREPPRLLMEIGLIFERMLEEGLLRTLAKSGSIQRPGELIHEDVFDGHAVHLAYSPDLIITNGDLRVGEIKATKMSPGVPFAVIADYLHGDAAAAEQVQGILSAPKFDKYHCQVKLYARMLGTRLGRFYAYFINGVYRPTMDPIFLAWDVEYSQDELDMNYAMVMYHAIARKLI